MQITDMGSYGKPDGIVVIRVAQGMGVFDAFVQSQGAILSLKDLTPKVKGDENLLSKYPFSLFFFGRT